MTPSTRTALRGSLVRAGHVWPLPIDDNAAILWTIQDELFMGDVVVLPSTDIVRPIRMGITLPPRLFSAQTGGTWNFFVMSHLDCPVCLERDLLDIEVMSITWDGRNYPDGVFKRPCGCGHEIIQDGQIVRPDW